MWTRRRFLQATPLISLAPLLPSFLSKTARAAGAASEDRVLVVLQLDGGNDGLNTVVPLEDDAYAKARPKLHLRKDQLLKLDDHVGLHPSMRAAKELVDDGKLAIVQGVGYPNPNRSHFESMNIWQTASLDDRYGAYGWLGRALDGPPLEVKQPASKAMGSVFIGNEETPLALWARRSATVSLASADDLSLELAVSAMASNPTDARDGSLQQFIQREVASAYASAQEYREQQGRRNTTAGKRYPATKLGSQLELVSQLLQSKTQARVYYLIQSGYDTHASQLNTHADLLSEFSRALKAFLDDLGALKLDDRVVVLAFSEFGRRVAENDSAGTDHGAAGPVFLAGAPVHAGLLGLAPNLADLRDGDLRMQFDFRQIYATLLDGWLDIPSRDALGIRFEVLPILQS